MVSAFTFIPDFATSAFFAAVDARAPRRQAAELKVVAILKPNHFHGFRRCGLVSSDQSSIHAPSIVIYVNLRLEER
jgi:hypothetical protein